MRTLSFETTTHGRVEVRDPAVGAGAGGGLLVAFHGYAQSAAEMLDDVARIPGLDGWRIAAVQGLHRFYARREQRVIASWMTREDREDAIVDNVAYAQRVVDALREADEPLVFVGFSQGASMAYRAALLGRHPAAGIVALAGDIPPEVRDLEDPPAWPPVLIGVGSEETWYTAPRLHTDLNFLRAAGVTHDVARFRGGHEWTDEFRDVAGTWLARCSTSHTG